MVHTLFKCYIGSYKTDNYFECGGLLLAVFQDNHLSTQLSVNSLQYRFKILINGILKYWVLNLRVFIKIFGLSIKILGSRKTLLAVYLVEFVKWLYQGLNSPHRVEIQALTPRCPLFHFVPYRLKTWLYSSGNLKTKIIIEGLFGICSFHNFIFTIELCLNMTRKFYVFLIHVLVFLSQNFISVEIKKIYNIIINVYKKLYNILYLSIICKWYFLVPIPIKWSSK